MKKLVLALIAMVCGLGANAELRWGPTASVNFNTFHWKEPLLDTHLRTSFDAGIMTEVMIPGIGFGVDAGLTYGMRSARVNFGQWEIWNTDGFKDETVNIHTINIPLHLRFKYTRLEGVEEIIAPLAFAGPVFSFNVAGNCKALEQPVGTVSLDFGLGCELFQKFQVSVGYLWGLSYATRTVKLENLSARADGFRVNLAYFF
ncbi:MAG: PorT family protein [Muribaculaceae bacterium]|nr:PorT family protein [Muribaculaceae bacterium]